MSTIEYNSHCRSVYIKDNYRNESLAEGIRFMLSWCRKSDIMNYLVYGSSFNLVDREVFKIVKGRPFESFNLDETPLEEILEDVGYDSMFAEDKVLVLRNFEVLLVSKKDNEKRLARLKDYLTSPNENTTLIFTSSEKVSSRGTGKDFLTLLKVVETPVIAKSYELSKIFGEVIREAGYRITPNALNIFCEKCVANYDIALMEFEKLKAIKKDNTITESDIEEYVSNYNTDNLFAFKDAVLSRNIKLASEMLDDLESSKMEIVPLVVMLAKEYQTLYNVKLLAGKKYTNDKIGEELNKMHPYRVKLLRELSNKYNESELEKLILKLCDLDLRIVSEDNLGFDELRQFLLLL